MPATPLAPQRMPQKKSPFVANQVTTKNAPAVTASIMSEPKACPRASPDKTRIWFVTLVISL
jgi:hypothetical protein